MNVHESRSAGSGTYSFAETLRERTKQLHLQAEKSGIIADMLRGRIDRHGYVLLLRNLLPAYEQLEAGLLQNRHQPGVRLIALPELFRSPALESDIRAIAGTGWQQDLPLLPAARRYADSIAESAKEGGARLVAHAYTRYLGDLSGGQILKRVLGKALDLGADALRFYDFPQIPDLAAGKASLREKIDLSGSEIKNPQAVIEESLSAFKHNIKLSIAVKLATSEAQDRA